MRNSKALLIGAISMLAVASSCHKTGSTGPVGPVGPAGAVDSGAISGHVFLFDQYGSRVLTGLSSVQLQLSGGATMNSDNTGYYIFGSTKTGDYSITATNSGYAATQTNNFQYLTDTLNRDIKLSAIPDSFLYTFNAYHIAGVASDSLVFTFKHDTRQRYCIVFASNTPSVGNLPGNYLWSQVLAISATAPLVTYIVPAQVLTDAGMASGSTVYYAAYSYVAGDASVYEDVTTGKMVYNAVNGKITSSAIVP